MSLVSHTSRKGRNLGGRAECSLVFEVRDGGEGSHLARVGVYSLHHDEPPVQHTPVATSTPISQSGTRDVPHPGVGLVWWALLDKIEESTNKRRQRG